MHILLSLCRITFHVLFNQELVVAKIISMTSHYESMPSNYFLTTYVNLRIEVTNYKFTQNYHYNYNRYTSYPHLYEKLCHENELKQADGYVHYLLLFSVYRAKNRAATCYQCA